MLSEFAALGKLTAIEAARSQGRKYGIRLWPVLQDIHQLRDIYGPHGAESFAGQCQAVFSFAPGEWESAEVDVEALGRRKLREYERQPVERPARRQRQLFGATAARMAARRILDLPAYHGLLWLKGRSKAVPVYAEPYIDEHGRIRPLYLRAGARPDPYHDESPAPPRRPVFPPQSAPHRSPATPAPAPAPIAAPSDLEQRAMRLLAHRLPVRR